VTYWDPETGKRHETSATFATEREAKRWSREQEMAFRADPHRKPPSDETWASYWERWLTSVAATRLRDTTVKAYRRYGAPLCQAFGAKPLKALTPVDFQAVLAQMALSGKAPSTIHHTYVVAHSACDQAVAWGLIPANPTDRVKPPRVNHPEIVPPTVEDLQRFLAVVADDRFQALWWLIALTGLRKGEALALKWSDIDWTRYTLRVLRTVAADGGLRSIHEAKTAAGRRTVALSPYLEEILSAHRQRQGMEREVFGQGGHWNPEGWVFCSERGTLLWPANVNRRFRTLRQRAGLPDTVRIHDLRHAMATLWLSQGVPVKVVSERLGHAHVSITLQIYGHLLPHMQAEAAAAMEAHLMDAIPTIPTIPTTSPRTMKNGVHDDTS